MSIGKPEPTLEIRRRRVSVPETQPYLFPSPLRKRATQSRHCLKDLVSGKSTARRTNLQSPYVDNASTSPPKQLLAHYMCDLQSPKKHCCIVVAVKYQLPSAGAWPYTRAYLGMTWT